MDESPETPRIDKFTPEENTNRNFVDIVAELNDKLIKLGTLRDEYLRAMPQLKKMKGKKLKRALHYQALIKTQEALMKAGLEDNSDDIWMRNLMEMKCTQTET